MRQGVRDCRASRSLAALHQIGILGEIPSRKAIGSRTFYRHEGIAVTIQVVMQGLPH